jgi:hypothetical protein
LCNRTKKEIQTVSTKERLKALIAEYGRLAIWIHIAVFFVVLSSFTVAIAVGFQTDSATAGGGTLLAAYLATKATSPLRIGFTLAATPVVARLFRAPETTPEG